MKKLTAKQERFIEEYLVDLNATQAAIRAGYSELSANVIACETLTKPYIQDEIQKRQKKRSKRTEITQDWVLSNLKDIAERCMQARPVLDKKGEQIYGEDPNGNVVPAYVFNAASAIKSIELLGKHLGMFNDAKIEFDPKDINFNVSFTSKPKEDS